MQQPTHITLSSRLADMDAQVAALARLVPNPPVFSPYKGTGVLTTSSTTFDPLWVAMPYRRGARMGVSCYVDLSAAGTAQLRLRMASPVALSTSAVTVPGVGSGYTFHMSMDSPDGWGSGTEAVVFVEGLVSVGTITLTARVTAAWQR